MARKTDSEEYIQIKADIDGEEVWGTVKVTGGTVLTVTARDYHGQEGSAMSPGANAAARGVGLLKELVAKAKKVKC